MRRHAKAVAPALEGELDLLLREQDVGRARLERLLHLAGVDLAGIVADHVEQTGAAVLGGLDSNLRGAGALAGAITDENMRIEKAFQFKDIGGLDEVHFNPPNSGDVELQLDVGIHAAGRLDGIAANGRVGDREVLGLLGRQAEPVLDDAPLVGEGVRIATDLVAEDDVLVGAEEVGHLLAEGRLPLLGIGFFGIVLDEVHDDSFGLIEGGD
mmetsp:Transcript_8768/g.20681  ORF Transcript_8768/g.20681 Transcript_8768/m.20681 type:complete len:212 (-) Transcript_8768:47-682(-)